MTRHRRRNPTRTQNPQPEPCQNTWPKCATCAVYAGKSRAESTSLDTRETQNSPAEVTNTPQSESASANSTLHPSTRPQTAHAADASPNLINSRALVGNPSRNRPPHRHFASSPVQPSHKQSECDAHHVQPESLRRAPATPASPDCHLTPNRHAHPIGDTRRAAPPTSTAERPNGPLGEPCCPPLSPRRGGGRHRRRPPIEPTGRDATAFGTRTGTYACRAERIPGQTSSPLLDP